MPVEPFSALLVRKGIELTRGKADTLQINVGLVCNQACRHCHLEAGPSSREMMDLSTMSEVLAFAGRARFRTVDITGGAPEMNPHLGHLIERLSSLVQRIMLRSNLTALVAPDMDSLLGLCRRHRVVITASLPSLSASQTESLRGRGVWEKSITVLQMLNLMGYGHPESGLELNLVSNPAGAFLPSSQSQAERRFRTDLQKKFGILFNNLYTFANVPLGRFKRWLQESDNYEAYVEKLAASFNPCTIQGLMCRTLLSVAWDGYLYDCDFNLASGLGMSGRRIHVAHVDQPPEPGTPIAVSDHCYACTAGLGFT